MLDEINLHHFPMQHWRIYKGNLHTVFHTQLGIGGLDKEVKVLLRRALASRLLAPEMARRLGIKHVRGILLHGPPGTGIHI